MNTQARVITAVIALLVAGVFFAGCSDSSTTTGDSSAQVSVAATETTSGALYAAGDIVKNAKSSSSSALMIISYDPATDMYERALIYPNTDGTWGYRMDSKTEKISRATLEKTFTKVGSVTVSSITIGAPTTATTVATTTTTKVTTVATTATATTASTTAPKITDIDPFIGTAGTSVTSDITGSNFVSGITAALTKSGESPINASSVSYSTTSEITCVFVIPLGTTAGSWNVVVTNPDKQSYTYSSQFTIYKNTSATATATTTTSSSSTSGSQKNVTIYSLSPNIVTLGGGTWYDTIIISGTNLSVPSNFILIGSSNITSSSHVASSNMQAQATFSIPAGYAGTYTFAAVDSNGVVIGSLDSGFTVSA